MFCQHRTGSILVIYNRIIQEKFIEIFSRPLTVCVFCKYPPIFCVGKADVINFQTVKGGIKDVNLIFQQCFDVHHLPLSLNFLSGRQLDLVIHILFSAIRQHHHSIIEYAFFLAEQTFHLDTPIL